MIDYAIVTISDSGARGERSDLSGDTIEQMMPPAVYRLADRRIIPDEYSDIEATLRELSDGVNLILTTGGTGFSPRDITPEATRAVIERETPGISEALRAYSLQITPRAMLSRAVSGIRGSCLIINLPGSPKAVRESLEYLLESLGHGLDILLQRDGECAR